MPSSPVCFDPAMPCAICLCLCLCPSLLYFDIYTASKFSTHAVPPPPSNYLPPRTIHSERSIPSSCASLRYQPCPSFLSLQTQHPPTSSICIFSNRALVTLAPMLRVNGAEKRSISKSSLGSGGGVGGLEGRRADLGE